MLLWPERMRLTDKDGDGGRDARGGDGVEVNALFVREIMRVLQT